MSQPNNTLVRFRVEQSDDSGKQQLLTGKGRKRELFGSTSHKIVHTARFGYSSRPPRGSQGLAVALNGNPDQTFVVHVEHPDHRPTDLEEGESKVYDANGQFVHLKADGTVVISGGGATITMAGGVIILDGIVKLGGADADKPAAMLGTVDSAGHTDVSGLATRVLVK